MNTINLYDGGEEPVDQIGVLAPSGFPNKPYLKTNRSKIDKDKLLIIDTNNFNKCNQ